MPQDLTKITTPFGLLDEETQEALKAHGGPYEAFTEDGLWEPSKKPSWSKEFAYRVKPSPPKPREWWAKLTDGRIETIWDDEHCANLAATNAYGEKYDNVETVRLIQWPERAPLPDLPEGY